jgi:aerobic carbon-monoxide dehydrogenase medium subunit
MKPVAFDYVRPESIEEAVRLLVVHESEAKVLAGGQSLIPLMAFRLVRPATLVDITRIPGLSSIQISGDNATLGALTTHRAAEVDERLRTSVPLVERALQDLGHAAIRNAGTVGGSLAHADPAAEWPLLALVLDGVVQTNGPNGGRTIAADDLFVDWMQTSLLPGEIITHLKLRIPTKGARWGFEELARRRGDFALAGAAVVLEPKAGVVDSARVCLIGAGVTPIRSKTVERALIGVPLDSPRLEAAANLLDDDIDPLDDQHASSGYKRKLARVMLVRALQQAATRSRQVA